MWTANPTCGSPRIRDELAKLGLIASTATIRKYRPKSRGKPSQGWKTFLQNHAGSIAAMDFFVVPTVTFLCSTIGCVRTGLSRTTVQSRGQWSHPIVGRLLRCHGSMGCIISISGRPPGVSANDSPKVSRGRKNHAQLSLDSAVTGISNKERTVSTNFSSRCPTFPRARMAAFSVPMDFLPPTSNSH